MTTPATAQEAAVQQRLMEEAHIVTRLAKALDPHAAVQFVFYQARDKTTKRGLVVHWSRRVPETGALTFSDWPTVEEAEAALRQAVHQRAAELTALANSKEWTA